MGNPKTPEHRAKIAAAMKGRKHSAEARAKMAAAANDRWQDPSERERLSSIMINRTRVPAEDWTPTHSRAAIHNRVHRGLMPPAAHCSIDPSHDGPFHYDHCGDPPYSPENRFVVQSVCAPCHAAISAERRAGSGYKNRRVIIERECAHCGDVFVLRNTARGQQDNVYCSREHYDAFRSSR
jgi:hypothetical protein